MGDLQSAYWLLVVVPGVVSLVVRMALKIREKNLRPLINKKPIRVPPCHPSGCLRRICHLMAYR